MPVTVSPRPTGTRQLSRPRHGSSGWGAAPLGLTGASSVILGLQNLDFWSGLGFSLVTVATLVGAMESFFNWRSRWVLMESAQYRLRRIHDEIDYLLRATPPDQLTLQGPGVLTVWA